MDADEIPILPSALKRKYTEEDIRHALRNRLRPTNDQGQHHVRMWTGPLPAGS